MWFKTWRAGDCLKAAFPWNLESRPRGFHPQPLAERCVNLSTHTAPIKQPGWVLPHSYASSRFRLGTKCNRLTHPLCSGRITSLHRSYGRSVPVIRSVRSPRGVCRLCFSLGIGTTGSRSSAQEPGSESRPLYAGCRHPVTKHPVDLSREIETLPVLTTILWITTRHRGFTFVRLCRSLPA